MTHPPSITPRPCSNVSGSGSGTGRRGGGPLPETHGSEITSTNPATGETIAGVSQAAAAEYEAASSGPAAFETWRLEPAPRRGEIVRQLGEALRRHARTWGGWSRSRSARSSRRAWARSRR